MSQFTQLVQETSDGQGNISFTLPDPPPSTILTGAMMIPNAPSGAMFQAVANDTNWGTWAGPTQHAPVQTNPQIPIVVTGTGLLPNTLYTLSFTCDASPQGLEPAVWPSTTLTTPYVTQELVPSAIVTFAGAGAFENFGPFPTQGFASLRLLVGSPISSGQLAVNIRWSDVNGNIVASRLAIVNEVAELSVQTPHLAEFVSVLVQKDGSASTITSLIGIQQTTETAATFAGLETQFGTATINGIGSATLISLSMLYGGPAYVTLNPGGATTWTAHLFAKFTNGTLNQIARWSNADIGSPPSIIRETVIVPPWPLSLDFNNGAAGTVTPLAGLILDAWRA